MTDKFRDPYDPTARSYTFVDIYAVSPSAAARLAALQHVGLCPKASLGWWKAWLYQKGTRPSASYKIYSAEYDALKAMAQAEE